MCFTGAGYIGAITATYLYAYDPVGNMTAYTETLNTQTTRVTRYFDDANRLQAAFGYDQGTTSYLYDNNGNLTLIIPPNGSSWLHYGYDQRNLMITHTLSVTGTNPQLQAEYVYDGAGNRVQQVDDTGASPAATTYINDIVGLTQVLLADDGAEQVYNLFGLDMISQDEGTNIRYLLADGLGSVRTEIVDGSVESVTTYDPYGNLLTQTGDSGTTYGYTGEQYDDATDLLYLRARYYNPALRSFMGRDPWSGNGKRPQSMNGWSYVGNSPINWVDPTGMIPKRFPDHCRKASSYPSYGDCVRAEYGVMYYHGDYEDFVREHLNNVAPTPDETGCYEGPVTYRARGYIEGLSADVGVAVSFGLEMVYDFATMEKQNFGYIATPSLTASSLYGGVFKGRFPVADWFNYSFSASVGYLSGFRNWTGEGVGGIINDYSGYFRVVSVGASSLPGLPYSGSVSHFSGDPDTTIRGIGFSFGFSANVWDLLGIPNPVNWRLDASISYAYYKALGTTDHYYTEDENGRRWVQPARVSGDILLGLRSPLTYAMGTAGILAYTGVGTVPALTFIGAGVAARSIGAYQAYQDAQIYNGIHRDSYSQ